MKIFHLNERTDINMSPPAIAATNSRAFIPRVQCEACGQLWGSSVHTISRSLPEKHWLNMREPSPVSYEEYLNMRTEVKSLLNVDDDVLLYPGTRIGPERVIYKNANVQTFEWPKLFIILIREDVYQFLKSSSLSGWMAVGVDIINKPVHEQMPLVKQLIITGRGGSPLTNPRPLPISRCEVCGFTRHQLHKLHSFQLDQSQWDGSDIFTFDFPFRGAVFVTERFALALERTGFNNYVLQSTDDWIENYNSFRS